jgi:hypothetical protein
MNSPVLDLVAQIRRQEVRDWLSRDVASIARDLVDIGMPAAAVRAIAKIMERDFRPADPPRSWPAEMKEMFEALPEVVRNYIAHRDFERDRALRKTQDEAANLRRENQKLRASLHPTATQQQQPIRKEENVEEVSRRVQQGPAAAAQGQVASGPHR